MLDIFWLLLPFNIQYKSQRVKSQKHVFNGSLQTTDQGHGLFKLSWVVVVMVAGQNEDVSLTQSERTSLIEWLHSQHGYCEGYQIVRSNPTLEVKLGDWSFPAR